MVFQRVANLLRTSKISRPGWYCTTEQALRLVKKRRSWYLLNETAANLR
jgi:hypothetical protein